MYKTLFATAAVVAGTSLSFAQTTTNAGYLKVEDESLMVLPFNLSVDEIDDMEIIGANGEEIGEVDEVLMTADGQITAVSAEVGGFLGIGETEVVFPLTQLSLRDDELVTPLTKEQVEALEEWID